MLRHASSESAEKLSYDNLMRRRVQLEVELDSLEKEKHKASQAHLVEVREELDDSREKHEPLMTNYKKEKQRINEIERLRQKREELLFELQEAEIRYELARDAELRYRAIEDDMEEGPGNSSKVVRFWCNRQQVMNRETNTQLQQ